MTVVDILPWLNILLVPSVALLSSINTRLATLEAETRAVKARLHKLDGIHA